MHDIMDLTAPLTPAECASTFSTRQDGHDEREAIIPVPDGVACDYADKERGKPDVLYPYHDRQGRLMGYLARWNAKGEQQKKIKPLCYCRFADGKMRWSAKGLPKPWPLYRLPEIVKNTEKRIVICEGEKTAKAAQLLFPQWIATTPMHGAQSPQHTDWQVLHGRTVIICPDIDEAGEKFGDAVFTLCRKAGAEKVLFLPLMSIAKHKVVDGALQPREDSVPQGYDLADAMADGWTPALLKNLLKENHLPSAYFTSEERASFTVEPQNASFWLKENGVHRLTIKKTNDGGEEREWVFLCSFLKLVAYTRNNDGQEWGSIYDLIDKDKKRKEVIVASSLLAGDGREYRDVLFAKGLNLIGSKTYLHQYLSSSNTSQRARCVAAVGWHQGTYVLPDRTYGEDKSRERIVLQNPHLNSLPSYPLRGSLKEWQENIGRYAVGNSRLAFCISTALAAAVMHLLREDNAGLHLSGASSMGKSTALYVAQSVTGSPLYTWRSTDNALEGIAASVNDNLLLLDELGQIDGAAAEAVAYMLGNGQGKARANRLGNTSPVQAFRLLFLSTGEIGLAEKLAERGKVVRAGQSVRFVEIPADAGKEHGLFETLYGFATAEKLAVHLRTAAEEYQGTAFDAFLRQVVKNVEEVRNILIDHLHQWLTVNVSPDANGQIKRVARKFALIAAAGSLATAWGILPWPKDEADRAAAVMLNAWMSKQGNGEPFEITETIHRLRALLEKDGSSRFEVCGAGTAPDNTQRIINRAGFRRVSDSGTLEYLLFRDTFRREICAGGEATKVAKILADKGIFLKDSQGKTSRSETIPGMGKQRMYAVAPSWLEGDAHG